MAQPHVGALQGALRATHAWRFAAFFMAFTLVLLAIIDLRAAGVQRTVIVPYQLIGADKPVKVSGQPAEDADYLQLLARADLDSSLNWQPMTIAGQIGRFLSRLTPDAYASYNLDLRAEVEKYSQLNVAESFYVDKVAFLPPDGVSVEGVITRYQGQQEVLHSKARYVLRYSIGAAGSYLIRSMTTEQV